jgi:flagellar basal-body rod modification protein FlgD
MTTMPIGAATTPTTTATEPVVGYPTDAGYDGSATASTPTNQLDKDTFLKLMVAQLRNQDPMNPQDSSEFLAQTAQFTSLEQLTTVADQTSQALAAQMAFGASGLAGRTVSYLDEDGVTELSGAVDTVRFTASGPVLTVGGTDVPISNVVAVLTGASATPTTTPPGTEPSDSGTTSTTA